MSSLQSEIEKMKGNLTSVNLSGCCKGGKVNGGEYEKGSEVGG